MASIGSIVGRKGIVGPAREYQVPIDLDPEYYKGGIILGSDGFIYHSDGNTWRTSETSVSSINLIGTIASLSGTPQADLNAAFPGAVQNDAVLDESTNNLWAYDGTAWINLGNIVGPTGPTGIQGVQGAASTVPGPTGPTGPVGQQGPTGAQGTQGTFGPQGIQGIQGTFGTSITIIGNVADVNVDPPNDPQTTLDNAFPSAVDGNGVIDELSGDLWVYNGAVWENVGRISGPQGIQGVQGSDGIQGVPGSQGSLGVQGSQGIQGSQGTQASQGIQGPLGLQGNQGVQGTKGTSIDIVGTVPDVNVDPPNDPQTTLNDYVQNDLGLTLTAGQAVINTADGHIWVYDGAAWVDEGRIVGPTGPQGIQGNQGPQGLQGRQGTQAAQGTDGQQGTQGIQGTQGTSITIVGSISTVGGDPQTSLNAAFPSANTGDGVIAQDTGDFWIYDGSLWNNAGQIRGPQGLQGTQGVQGVQGVQGTFGPQGIQGIDGTLGSQGLQGLQGIQGVQGTQGLQGIDGNLGAQGLQGLQGTQGVQGVQGIDGTLGSQGLQGLQGLQGIQGVQGTDGNTGSQGIQGQQGITGEQGVQGTQGLQGLQGLQGIQGITGVQGGTGQSEIIDATNDSTTTTLYPVMVVGTGPQSALITVDAGKLNFDASTGVLTTTASSSLYADLAEKYAVDDQNMEAGTVVVFGGDAEVTACTQNSSAQVAGVISTDPGLMMNSAAGDDQTHMFVALRGRVPCKVHGTVRAGDVLITSAITGYAQAAPDAKNVPAACVVGKAIENKSQDGPGFVEIMV